MKPAKLNLRGKLLLIVLIGLLLAFGSVAALRIYHARISIQENANYSGNERIKLIAESLSGYMANSDLNSIEAVTKRFVALPEVMQVNISNGDGVILTSQSSSRFDRNSKPVFFNSPIVFSGKTLGNVEMKVSTDRQDQELAETYKIVALSLIFATTLSGLILYAALSVLIVSPLIRLGKAAELLAVGDFTGKLPVVTQDELGDLVHTFSSMRDNRKIVELELSNLNASLESIVMARISELRDSEAYIHAVLDNVNEGIIVIGEAGVIVSFNTAAEKIFGYARHEMIDENFSQLISAENLDLSGKYHRYIEENESKTLFGVTREVVGLRKNFSAFPLELKTSQLRIQERLLFITTARDITERKEAEQRISYLASHDALTNLPNRTLLQDRIKQTLVHNHRRKLSAAVLFIDLDKFKIINDTLGHDVGDLMLKETAKRLVAEIRSEDTVARQGGDEFIILLSNISRPQDVGVVAQKLLDSLAQPFNIDDKELHISASIGIAIYPDDGNDIETLLKNSDIAMYHAKESGRSNYQYFSPLMNEQAVVRQALSNDLHHAIERNELFLVYQPVVDIPSGKLAGMEVLLRWQHPVKGLVSPVTFISLAEESGLILPIGEWVLRHTCLQLTAWQKQGYIVPRMAINLSAKQFRVKTLADMFASIFKETGAEPRYIGIEITESMLVHNVEDVVNTLLKLSNMGLEISIDDFGTGYSSLSYLKRFPINKIKIDKSFVDDITTHPDDAAIVKAIIAMAHGLSMKVVTEGVEYAEQLEFLRLNGCEQYQGYLYSKPLPAGQFTEKFLSL